MRRIGVALGLALLAAGCGKMNALAPVAGKALPPKPALAAAQPTSDQLLKPTTVARPTREEELLTRSELRRDDRFDLPPPG